MFFMNKPFITKMVLILGLFFFILDRVVKYLFYQSLLGNGFLLSYTKNYGTAFGLQLPEVFLILFYIILMLIMILLIAWLINSWHKQKYLDSLAVWFILLGASSNIIDRFKTFIINETMIP